MQFKSILFAVATLLSINAEKCPAKNDNCGDVSLPPNSGLTMDATLYSESNFKGEFKKVVVNGAYGCVNDVPDFTIKSLLSSGSTQVTLHYGKDCIGHVISQMQGGSFDLDSKKGCPGSIFIKHNRYGSC
ncbi:hypothetical protein K502DRAFT_320920 [Neoconidiobolus thromboides FSU 785]|nr:hypothetical protein K502DRAFT_320920 [Neoconidiobolus thromboides FSU 785]